MRFMRILIIEDNPADAVLIREILNDVDENATSIVHEKRLATGIACLSHNSIDIILLDLGLPDSQGLDTLRRVYESAGNIPIVVMTGLSDKALGLNAVQMGAQDYLIKGQFDGNLLIHSLHYAIERRKFQERIEETEEQFRAIFEQAAVGIAQVGLSGQWFRINKRLCEILQYDCEELLKRNIHELIHPLDLQASRESIERLIRGDIKNSTMEIRYLKSDGSIVWVNLTRSLVRDSAGNPKYFISVLEDISRRKDAEAALHEIAASFTTIFRETPSPIAITSLEDNTIIDVNSAFERISGYKRDEVIGKSTVQMGLFENNRDRDRIYREIRRKGVVRDQEINFRMKTGTTAIGLLSSAIIEMNGKPSLLTVVTDITDRRRAIEQIKQYVEELQANKLVLEENARKMSELNDNLRDLNLSKDKFFSIVAHDLRSPFSALLGFSEYLSQNIDELTTEEIKEYTGRIHKSLLNVFKLIENLLQWSRLQTNRLEFSPVSFSLNSLIEDIIEIYHGSAVHKGIKLIDLTPENINIRADKDMIETVIRNLISNAIKFTEREGSITIKAARYPGYTEVEVEDTGIGISHEDQSRLFKLDENITTIGTEKEKGTGLGLIISREFVEKHGGTLRVESTPGKGSRFIFTLPDQANG